MKSLKEIVAEIEANEKKKKNSDEQPQKEYTWKESHRRIPDPVVEPEETESSEKGPEFE